jgi:hypothetical protein
MAGALSYNPSTKMGIKKKNGIYTPGYSSAIPEHKFRLWLSRLPLYLIRREPIDRLFGSHATTPNISENIRHHTTTATKSSVRNILKRQASTITEEGFQNFDLSVSGSFRLTTNQIRESKSNRLEQLRIFIVLHFGRVSPSLVISIFFLFHLI